MSMDIVSRLRCVLKGDKTAQAGADEIERLRAELAASREREARMREALSMCRDYYTRLFGVPRAAASVVHPSAAGRMLDAIDAALVEEARGE